MRIRELFQRFKPYGWETPSWEIAERFNLKPSQIVRMDLNTSPYLPEKWVNTLQRRLPRLKLNLYPDTTYRALREAISGYAGVGTRNIVVSNGGDEGIEIVVKAFIDPGTEAIISSPSYEYFRVAVELAGGRVREVSRGKGFADNVDGILSAINQKTRLILLCSPNNPTGNSLEYNGLVKILEEVGDMAVVVDEAYYEYSGKTFVELTESFSNLIIIRTLSKAFSLAGARVGYLMAAEETVKLLNMVRPPNSLSIPSMEMAMIALRDWRTAVRNASRIVKERERVRELLASLPGVQVYPSDANFLLFHLTRHDPDTLHRKLMEKGIVIRNLNHVPGLQGHLRVTISLPQHNDRFLKLTQRILRE